MGHILLGHGGLLVDPSVLRADMETVAIPRGTSIQFYADTGQLLGYGAEELALWERIRPWWAPLDSRHVTYNLVLESSDTYEEDLRDDPWFGGHRLVRPGIGDVPDPVLLCAGTPDTCPTRPEQVAAGARHRCRGILGREDMVGELHWVACTAVVGSPHQAVVAAALHGRPARTMLGEHPDRALRMDECDLRAVAEVNGAVVHAAGDGESLEYLLGGSAFLISPADRCAHLRAHERYALCQEDVVDGVLTVRRASEDWPDGVVEVTDVPYDRQDLVQAALGELCPGAEIWFLT
ncbi:hypothetical protein [Streptomyces sp. WAC06614]|uniref:hypothetical protein n=1 Tax=Streptomyces sp. WAC06614 TaxID=2487416 RepID=UPI000F7A2D11|nr:hypothetical protein [Streptomyces sp. WAC06614]RSS79389.1 hypothetical protein EF918_17595 [Streptomyces sp. WAC06614]